jgi:hypothetical protein
MGVGLGVGLDVTPGVGVVEARGVGDGVTVGNAEPAGEGDVDGPTDGVAVGVPPRGSAFAVPPDPLQPAIAMKDANSAPPAKADRAFSTR